MAGEGRWRRLGWGAGALWLVGGAVCGAPAREHYPPEVALPATPHPLISVAARTVAWDVRNGAALSQVEIAIPAGSDVAGLEPAWRPFLGQPVSPGLIAAVEDALNARLAQAGRPLTARWVEDAAAGNGVLRFEVGQFTIGQVVVNEGRDALTQRLGLTPGMTVDERELARDLTSLNRYPFRQVAAQFVPGATGGRYDLTLNVTRQKPWEAYVGFKYSGSNASTWRRYYGGGTIGNWLGRDSVLAVQATGSPDIVLHGARHPNVADVFVTYSLPVTRHGQVEASVEGLEINFSDGGSTFRLQDVLGGLGYRLDLAAPKGGQRDVRAGVEARHERTMLITPGQVAQSAIEVYQVFAGYHTAGDRADGHDDLDVIVHISPGGINGGSSTRQAVTYSEGREKTARFAYAMATYEGDGRLGTRFTWHSTVMAQVASAALPYTEQLPVGGLAYVRGYKLYDGSFDHVLILRQELGLHHAAGKPGVYMFVDAGEGRDIGLKRSMTLGSVGVGIVVPVKACRLNVFGVHTLGKGDVTRAGTDELEVNLMLKY